MEHHVLDSVRAPLGKLTCNQCTSLCQVFFPRAWCVLGGPPYTKQNHSSEVTEESTHIPGTY